MPGKHSSGVKSYGNELVTGVWPAFGQAGPTRFIVVRAADKPLTGRAATAIELGKI